MLKIPEVIIPLPCPFNCYFFLFRHCAARGRLGCPHGAESADREQGGSVRSSQASRPLPLIIFIFRENRKQNCKRREITVM
jgi:hypothetical protein